jgi:hypothetical protein
LDDGSFGRRVEQARRFEHVPALLRRLQAIRLGVLSVEGKPIVRLLSKIPRELNQLLEKLRLLPLFAHPPKWAM